MNKMDFPDAASDRMIAIKASISWGVRTAVGSSRISNSASWLSAFRISTRC